MANEDKDSKSPLKGYEHLLPPSCHFVNSLSQHLFLVNVSILFPTEDPETLRLTIARTTDRAHNATTGSTETRQLFYAALIRIYPDTPTEGLVPSHNPTKALIKGPAVPYFSLPTQEQKSAGTYNAKFSMSYSTNRTDSNEESDLREVKEKAMSLLMGKMENEVHKVLAVDDGEIEIWEAKDWKYAPASVKEENTGKEESISHGTVGHGKKRESWFSKS